MGEVISGRSRIGSLAFLAFIFGGGRRGGRKRGKPHWVCLCRSLLDMQQICHFRRGSYLISRVFRCDVRMALSRRCRAPRMLRSASNRAVAPGTGAQTKSNGNGLRCRRIPHSRLLSSAPKPALLLICTAQACTAPPRLIHHDRLATKGNAHTQRKWPQSHSGVTAPGQEPSARTGHRPTLHTHARPRVDGTCRKLAGVLHRGALAAASAGEQEKMGGSPHQPIRSLELAQESPEKAAVRCSPTELFS